RCRTRVRRGWSVRPPSGSAANRKTNEPCESVRSETKTSCDSGGELGKGSTLRLYDCSTREQEINGPLTPQPVVQAPDSALLFKPRAHRRRRAARALRVPSDLGFDVAVRHRHGLAPRHLVEHERAPYGFGRGVVLAFAEFLPVDVRLHRIDLLIDQPPDELLNTPIDLALEQRLRHIERDA